MKTFKSVLFPSLIVIIFTACMSFTPPPAGAAVTLFVLPVPTVDANGNPVTAPVHHRIYCGNNPPVEVGSGLLEYPIKNSFPADTADGVYACFATMHLNKPCPDMDTGVCEGEPTNTVTVVKRGPLFFAGEEPSKGFSATDNNKGVRVYEAAQHSNDKSGRRRPYNGGPGVLAKAAARERATQQE